MNQSKNNSKKVALGILVVLILCGSFTAAIFFIKDVTIPLFVLAITNVKTDEVLMIFSGIFSFIGTPLMTFFFFVFLLWFTQRSVVFLIKNQSRVG